VDRLFFCMGNHKLFSGRPRDIEDVEGVVRIRKGELDWDYVEKWAGEFTSIPGRENLLVQVKTIRAEHSDQ